ncbi:bifunctional riboflavin kinase/FAD synthetase [Vitreimonas flagellata]|uniref:bifunctional riboflavin kinase/FAD synthetase n=1 Tax=Vitreimonas flagellata TaxID=2560861 RepID=UPI001074C45B|nr:bifunctional riboflavin kinase/FAD synthetase [Vitreimonas flagellata]
MRRHAPLDSLPDDARGAAIALGNFDGVHRGHQAVIASARAHSAHLGVALFCPHPRRFFQPDAPPFRLQSDAQRARALATLGVKDLFEIGFDADLAKRSDEDFAREILHQRLCVRHVSVGADYRFGRGRMGDAARLRELGARYGFSVDAVEAVKGDGERYSSTAARAALAAGDMDKAAGILSRPWAIEGVVQRGFQRGRGFGFATANVPLGDYARPRLGIYAVRIIIDGVSLPGVASIGVNPTVGALPEPLLEAHVFDFDAELYGKTIEVEMIAFLRDEAHFADVEALKTQMADDAAKARALLA